MQGRASVQKSPGSRCKDLHQSKKARESGVRMCISSKKPGKLVSGRASVQKSPGSRCKDLHQSQKAREGGVRTYISRKKPGMPVHGCVLAPQKSEGSWG
ncbi:hypothetical protein JW964_22540 [candidate division KSB1 bacterium]|nr:hypothetical protein [candidate division KSB1 bacterium]